MQNSVASSYTIFVIMTFLFQYINCCNNRSQGDKVITEISNFNILLRSIFQTFPMKLPTWANKSASIRVMVWCRQPSFIISTNVDQVLWHHVQGWGQFHFFNSIPIPIPLFSIPIPIPPLTISFNSNSNSNSGYFNSNSNSNSGDFKSRQSQFWKWPIDVFFEIDYNYTNKVHTCKIIVINTIILISLVKWL